MFQLTTARLVVRHFRVRDAEPLYQVFSDPEVMRFGDGVQTREWVQNWLQTGIEHYQAWGFGPYAVVKKYNRDVIGYCGLFYFPDINGQPEVEIGYRLARSAWGNGYATEAALAVRNYAFATFGLKRLIAMIDPSNVASIRVATKLGMHHESEIMMEGYTHHDHIYAVMAP